MKTDLLKRLNRLLVAEEQWMDRLKNTEAAQGLQSRRNRLLDHVHEVGGSGDLSLIIATERAFVHGDLDRHASGSPMTSSLKTALDELTAIERLIDIVDDRAKYRAVDQAHRLKGNRRAGLPIDEARQGLASHFARLGNMTKVRLSDDERQVKQPSAKPRDSTPGIKPKPLGSISPDCVGSGALLRLSPT